jgi:hypothetical protein
MALVKVWNDNSLPFKQKFKGETYEIAPHSYIEMEYDLAVAFKSSPVPMTFDGQGPTPAGYKMIRVEGRRPVDDSVKAWKSHVDGSLHVSKEAAEAHDAQFVHRRAADVEVPIPSAVKKGK